MAVVESLMNKIRDCEPPLYAKLSPKFKRSFAYPSMKDRVPVILTQIVDYLSRDKATIISCYGEEVQDEIKAAIGEISLLKNHILTSKDFQYFTSQDSDTELWNEHLKERERLYHSFNYFESDWLFSECYVYRRVREIFATKEMLRTLDPFSAKKTELLRNSLTAMSSLFSYLIENNILDSDTTIPIAQLQKEFVLIMKSALWANQFDLSLNTNSQDVEENMLSKIKEWDDKLLVDDSIKLFSSLCSTDNTEKIVDYVVDNAGLELICDLCFADLLITRFHVKKINIRVKPIPWFVSDTIPRDVQQTVSSVLCNTNEWFRVIGKRWQKYLDTGIWNVVADQYWCLGRTYSEMPTVDPQLYEELQEAAFIVMKGDLNYRKLLQDINWETTTPFSKALGDFHPAPLIALRTCKADLICGLKPGQAEKVAKESPNWLINGEYAVIQYDSPRSE
ncbi:hypothetical protein O3M35_005663 [Rhynocoris fuscipes]|uniref:Sugar phosphate phosphatase n=1 Tax=Rhynocoris fuscipes TaxID=488301 RepID=A0AAW1DRG9_9HEMI